MSGWISRFKSAVEGRKFRPREAFHLLAPAVPGGMPAQLSLGSYARRRPRLGWGWCPDDSRGWSFLSLNPFILFRYPAMDEV